MKAIDYARSRGENKIDLSLIKAMNLDDAAKRDLDQAILEAKTKMRNYHGPDSR